MNPPSKAPIYSDSNGRPYYYWINAQGIPQTQWLETGESSNTGDQLSSPVSTEPDGSYISEPVPSINQATDQVPPPTPPGQPKAIPDNRFHLMENPKEFFTKGRVFAVQWSEPMGSNAQMNASRVSSFHEIRMFIVMKTKPRRNHSICIPIHTYGNRGCLKPGLFPGDHSIIYTTPSPPSPLEGEELVKDPIQVIPDDNGISLRRESRVNFGKVYTVEHNWKVSSIGKVHRDDRKIMNSYFISTMG
ncbi:MAG: hypothetical protein M1834_002781 [Cirrosporium novae-zelandiae]|nr:MAG: hypothetical protein M1834_002781 [Cirrosporium novae-zelandiae]